MTVWKRAGIAVAATCVVVWLVKLILFPSAVLYYRLNVVFETPQGDRISSSGVWAVKYTTHIQFLPEIRRVQTEISGDAIHVPVPGGSDL